MTTAVDTGLSITYPTFAGTKPHIDKCSNGVLWAFWIDTSTAIQCAYSTDDGATWSTPAAGPSPAAGNNEIAIFIDQDDYCHFVGNQGSTRINYFRGTPNAGRTSWSWSSPETQFGSAAIDTGTDCVDVIAHREGTGWVAHVVYGVLGAFPAWTHQPINITSGGVISLGTADSTGVGVANGQTIPSIDFHHTGDGKTVAGGAPHLYVSYQSPNGTVKFVKYTYASGAWTKGAERTIVGSVSCTPTGSGTALNIAGWQMCRYDGTRVIIGVASITAPSLSLYERDEADTTTTTRYNSSLTGANMPFDGSLTYDSSGNIHIWGRSQNGTDGTADLIRYVWDRATTTLGSKVTVEAGTMPARANVGVIRSGESKIHAFMRKGTSSPNYSVQYASFSLNSTPNTPTNLQRTGLTSDTTPVFSVDISDPDTGQQIKARFTIESWDGAAWNAVGTVDSSFRTGAGNVTAEYGSALAIGQYRVKAQTVDDAGLISGATAWVTFNVTQTVNKDFTILWDVRAGVVKDTTLLWNVQVSNQVNFTLLWNVRSTVIRDFTLLWGQKDPWNPVPDPDNHETWVEVFS